ncbi:hypothetical protein [Streptomyces mirabilis]|uniref:hypothetical protein n=1 Tax=Streptomyces mirabilis TaxID=68239 RepID=UPI00324AC93A
MRVTCWASGTHSRRRPASATAATFQWSHCEPSRRPARTVPALLLSWMRPLGQTRADAPGMLQPTDPSLCRGRPLRWSGVIRAISRTDVNDADGVRWSAVSGAASAMAASHAGASVRVQGQQRGAVLTVPGPYGRHERSPHGGSTGVRSPGRGRW